MLFRKNIERCCAHCLHGTAIDDDNVICIKKGIVPLWDKCRSFDYDPLKRIPDLPEPLHSDNIKADSFDL
ncbi:MAG: hypothetical protein GXY20_09275 [Clostridiales bacterium]|nr:hypothetical protein [Clostridiales bacterium]